MTDQQGDPPRPDDKYNVSHFLFPALPQFPATQHGQLQQVLKQAFLDEDRERRAEEQIKKLEAAVTQLAQLAQMSPAERERVTHHKSRANARWDTYTGFRDHMRELEMSWTDDNSGRFEKTHAAAAAGCVRETITRRMKDFNLDPRWWPPSSWPEQEPPKQLHLPIVPAHSILAAGIFVVGLLDVIADGEFDGVEHIMRLFCHLGPTPFG